MILTRESDCAIDGDVLINKRFNLQHMCPKNINDSIHHEFEHLKNKQSEFRDSMKNLENLEAFAPSFFHFFL